MATQRASKLPVLSLKRISPDEPAKPEGKKKRQTNFEIIDLAPALLEIRSAARDLAPDPDDPPAAVSDILDITRNLIKSMCGISRVDQLNLSDESLAAIGEIVRQDLAQRISSTGQ